MAMINDLYSYLELDATDITNYASLLSMMLDAVKARADSFLGLKHFDQVVGRTQTFNGFRKIFSLDHANVSSVAVVIATADDEELVDESAYVVDNARGIVKTRTGELQAGKNAVEITYSGGYAEASIPKDMQFAVIKQTAYEFRRRKDPGLSVVTFPDGSATKHETGAWLPEVEETLRAYRRIAI